MKLCQTRALVLRSRPLGERDRLLTLFSRERGKLSAVAPGARKIKSKLAAGVDYFTCASFLLYKGKTFFTVSQLEIELIFHKIREDIKDYAYGLYFAELVDKLLEEGEPHPQAFQLLFEGWSALNEKKTDREILARFFELKILSLSGYRPHFANCLYCGNAKGPFFWNSSSGGLFCTNCRPREGAVFPFSRGTQALAASLLNSLYSTVVNIRATEEQKKELSDFTRYFLQYWTDSGPFKGLSFLEKVNSFARDKKTNNASE